MAMWRGRLWQPNRERFRRWLEHDVRRRAGGGPVAIAVEGCTGWRYVVEEITVAGFEPHVAEPADTQAALAASRGRRPIGATRICSVCSWRMAICRIVDSSGGSTRVARTHPGLQGGRRSANAVGVADPCRALSARCRSAGVGDPFNGDTAQLADIDVSPAARQRLTIAYSMIDASDAIAQPLKRELQRFGERQPSCRALSRALRDRWAVSDRDLVRAWRLPPVQPFDAGRTSLRARRHRRPVRSSSH